MTPRRTNRDLVAGIIAMLAVAVVLGTITANAFRGPDRYFMPGPLGRERGVRSSVQLVPPGRGVRTSAGEDGSSIPSYLTRAIGLRTAAEQEWGRRNGVTPSLPFSHALDRVFPPELASSHPEFFPSMQGRRYVPPKGNYYWNPDLGREDVARYAAEQARAHFQKNPGAESFALGINDGLNFGDSPETLRLVTPIRWFRGRPDFTPLVFTFMNRAADELARTHPHKYLGALAYYWAENAPPFRVHPQVVPFLTADRSQSYDPSFREEEFDLQRRWAAAMGARSGRSESANNPFAKTATAGKPGATTSPRLGLYDYLDGYGFLVPRVPIRAFAEHIKHAHEAGFTDYYGESSRNWGLDGPMPWLIAALLQDVDQDVEALLDEYYRSYFKQAAGPMRQFFERCEQQWMSQTGPSYWLKYYRSEAQADLFPPAVLTGLRALLNEAAALAGPVDDAHAGSSILRHFRVSRNLVARRVAFVADSFGVTERFVAFQRKRAELAAQTLKGAVRGKHGADLLRAYINARREFLDYTKRLTSRWPLAFYPINVDDWTRNDPAFAAAAVLATAGPADEQSRSGTGSPESFPRVTAATDFTDSSVIAGFEAADARRRGGLREILSNGSLAGPLQSGLRMAGLQYGADLPAPWHSKLEPTERHTAQVVDVPLSGRASRALLISGAENSTVYQWVPAKPGRLYVASVQACGRVSSGDAVVLTIGFLDGQQRPVGAVTAMRLPDGEWPDWVQLSQGARAPSTAAQVGIGIRVQHQVGTDWAQFANFSIKESQR